MSMSSSGQYQVALSDTNSNIYYSSDYGLTWTPGSLLNDWIGINYYFDTPMKSSKTTVTNGVDPAGLLGLIVDQTPPPPLTDMGWPISPDGLSNLLIRWHKEFGNQLPPVFITENGVAYSDGPGADGKIHDQRRSRCDTNAAH